MSLFEGHVAWLVAWCCSDFRICGAGVRFLGMHEMVLVFRVCFSVRQFDSVCARRVLCCIGNLSLSGKEVLFCDESLRCLHFCSQLFSLLVCALSGESRYSAEWSFVVDVMKQRRSMGEARREKENADFEEAKKEMTQAVR